ncbi:MAG: hypothetical protein QM793_12560 [Muricomes sp.]
MPYTLMISLGVTAVLLLLSFIFRIAGKLRLTLPILYFLLTATVLNRWAAAHEQLALGILFVLVALSVISWLFSLRSYLQERRYYKAMNDDISWQIQRAKQRGIPLNQVHFDSQGNMRYNNTGDIVE